MAQRYHRNPADARPSRARAEASPQKRRRERTATSHKRGGPAAGRPYHPLVLPNANEEGLRFGFDPRLTFRGFTPRRLALVTDAWKPQTNGVVNTLLRLVEAPGGARGTEVLVIAPDAHRTVPLPSYPEIRIACDPWRAIPRLQAFAPDAVHVATEGPLGFWTSAGCARRGCASPPAFTPATPNT